MPTNPKKSDDRPEGDRIAKLLARAGVASRREIERMIADKRITLNGKPVETPATFLKDLRGVSVDGKPVAGPEPTQLYVFHKPSGLITAERDPAGRATIYSALVNALPKGTPRVMPIGRLDFNTEGLLLLTNDGGLKRTMELPSSGVPRTYRARAFGEIHQEQLEALSEGVEILSPSAIKKDYVESLVALRGHKGVTEVVAQELLEDNVTLGTMMLQQDDVDGLVSGAVNTTANTIRPALQLIKTAENASLVSSVFFMLLPDQVLVYGDCAINPDPNAQQLADIAIQSAESAQMFGIEPRVAMISYSTGSSGAGSDVEKVREATKIAQSLRPDLLIDGPLQYDAAAIESVGKSKAPNSPVAGKANVFVFPDLNTGNTTYKAVQRSFDLVCIGPMLQGMRKPVNDLSRGALVDDIVFTIALTAIQAAGNV